MKVRTFDTLQELMTFFGWEQRGRIVEDDVDVVETECDLLERKRRDAEVLSTLSANCAGPCLDIGTSHGRSAAEMALNNGSHRVYTVNLLPEQLDSGEELITHLLTREEIGSYYRALGCGNVEQIYENTAKWEVPEAISGLGMAFIDGNHDTRAVYSDSCLIFDRIRDGGFILWHDFSPPLRGRFNWIDSAMSGVEQFLQRAGIDGEVYHLKNSWIGFLRKDAAQSAAERPGEGAGLTDKTYWSEKHAAPFTPWTVCGMPFSSILEKYLPRGPGLSCAEIGAYPGANLCHLAKAFHYKPVAIEFSDFAGHINDLLDFNGISGYEVLQEDLFSVTGRQFDVVTSFGFVEHFNNYHDVIKRHFDLLKPGGFLVVSVPRFDGFQGALFELAFEPQTYRDMLAAHCQKIMDLNELKHAVSQHTDSILYCDYANDGIVYYDWKHPRLKDDKRWLIYFMNRASAAMAGSLPVDQFFSPHILLIARKPDKPFTPTSRSISEWVQSASEAICRGDFPGATSLLELAVQQFPECLEPYRILAELQIKLGQLPQAQRTLERAIDRSPQSRDFLDMLAAVYAASGNGSALKGLEERRAIWHPGSFAPASPAPGKLRLRPGPFQLTRPPVFPTSYPVQVLGQERNLVTCQANGNTWRLDATQYVDHTILANGVFEAESTYWVSRLVQPGMTVLDVGANFGYYAVQFSKLVGPAGKVYAFEPSGQFHRRLTEHLALNGCGNVIVSKTALSDKDEDKQLLVDDSTATLYWHDDAKAPLSAETVHLEPLDRYVRTNGIERVDFIKVDIDGSEIPFLSGARETLTRFRPILLIEFAQLVLMAAGGDAPTLAKGLIDLGYALYSETTGEAYATEAQFLREACNCSHSVNIICIHAG